MTALKLLAGSALLGFWAAPVFAQTEIAPDRDACGNGDRSPRKTRLVPPADPKTNAPETALRWDTWDPESVRPAPNLDDWAIAASTPFDNGVFPPDTRERPLAPFSPLATMTGDRAGLFPGAFPGVLRADSAPSIPGGWTAARPDGHAPIGVMGDHTHGAGEFMLSYRFMDMQMEDNLDGTDELSTDEVLEQFPVSPTDMGMQMHMLGAMYATSDNLTLMAMLPYVSHEMDHRTRMGTRFTTESSGIGDVSLSGLYKIFDRNGQRVHLNLGLSFPTGSIDARDDTPAGEDSVLPYPMQIGSGTYNLLPGVTYLGQSEFGSWGAQVRGRLHLGRNAEDYALGDRLQAGAWLARRWTDWLSTSLRLNFQTWGDIRGEDDRLNPMLIPTADPDRRSGSRLDLGLGFNVYDRDGFRIGAEFALPLYQSLDGPQLETDWTGTIGLQLSF